MIPLAESLRRRCPAGGFVLTLVIAACGSTEPDQPGVWGSNQASLIIVDGKATLQIVTPGDCYGSFGEIDQPIGSGSFTLSGTYTRFMGVYPGSAQYPAQFVGTVAGRHMTLSVSVPALQQMLGPFLLIRGVVKMWPPCLYPLEGTKEGGRETGSELALEIRPDRRTPW